MHEKGKFFFSILQFSNSIYESNFGWKKICTQNKNFFHTNLHTDISMKKDLHSIVHVLFIPLLFQKLNYLISYST